MRLLGLMGAVLMAVMGTALVLTQWPWSGQAAEPQPLVALDVRLGRPFVLYVDGDLAPDFRETLAALDAPNGALAREVVPRNLLDLDIYVMVRDDWDVFRALDGHDLGTLIRANAQGRGPDAGAAWFEAELTSPEGMEKTLLVVLATRAVLDDLGAFCFAVTVYDLARFARNGARFREATQGPGSYWKQCRAQGWSRPGDLPLDR